MIKVRSGNFPMRPTRSSNWMTTNEIDPVTGKRKKVLDLAGFPRISPAKGGTVDIGCYEWWLPPGLIFFVR